jgi:predicted enzyme related to lactoylglutathione lyase
LPKRFSRSTNLFDRLHRLLPVEAAPQPSRAGETVMHIQFAELQVFDQDRAKAFYTGHLACQVAADQPMGNSGWRWVELTFPGAVTNLHFVRRADEAPGTEPVLVLVDWNVEAKIDALKARGVEIITEPQEASWQLSGRTFQAHLNREETMP